jgi:hypothetical protein
MVIRMCWNTSYIMPGWYIVIIYSLQLYKTIFSAPCLQCVSVSLLTIVVFFLATHLNVFVVFGIN